MSEAPERDVHSERESCPRLPAGVHGEDLETAASLAEQTGVAARALQACRSAWHDVPAAVDPDAGNTKIHRAIAEVWR